MKKTLKKKIQLKFPEKHEEKKSKRKIELRFKKPKKEDEEEEISEELEQIIERDNPRSQKTNLRISPVLELSDETLEQQLADTPSPTSTNADKQNTNQNPTNQYNTLIDKYSTGQTGNYSGGDSYEGRIKPSLETGSPNMQFSNQNNFMRNPTMFRQSNPFDTPDYPKPEEKKYDSPLDADKQKQRNRW